MIRRFLAEFFLCLPLCLKKKCKDGKGKIPAFTDRFYAENLNSGTYIAKALDFWNLNEKAGMINQAPPPKGGGAAVLVWCVKPYQLVTKDNLLYLQYSRYIEKNSTPLSLNKKFIQRRFLNDSFRTTFRKMRPR